MARGGYRPGSGRPAGVPTVTTRQLVAAIEATGTPDITIALLRIIEDQSQTIAIRLAACDRLDKAGKARVRNSIVNEMAEMAHHG